MTAVSVVPDVTYARNRVTVSGVTGTVNLTRLDPDGVSRDVRGGQGITGDIIVDDYEAPFGVAVTYTVDGVSDSATLDVTRPWLTHPTRPDWNTTATVVDDDGWSWEAPGTVHKPLGAEYPAVVYTDRTEHTGTLELAQPWADRDLLRQILRDGSPLLLRVPPSCPVDDAWIWPSVVTRTKNNRAAPTVVRWSLDYQRVDAPGGTITVDPSNSWDAVTISHTSWSAVGTDHATWEDLIVTAHPHAQGMFVPVAGVDAGVYQRVHAGQYVPNPVTP